MTSLLVAHKHERHTSKTNHSNSRVSGAVQTGPKRCTLLLLTTLSLPPSWPRPIPIIPATPNHTNNFLALKPTACLGTILPSPQNNWPCWSSSKYSHIWIQAFHQAKPLLIWESQVSLLVKVCFVPLLVWSYNILSTWQSRRVSEKCTLGLIFNAFLVPVYRFQLSFFLWCSQKWLIPHMPPAVHSKFLKNQKVPLSLFNEHSVTGVF